MEEMLAFLKVQNDHWNHFCLTILKIKKRKGVKFVRILKGALIMGGIVFVSIIFYLTIIQRDAPPYRSPLDNVVREGMKSCLMSIDVNVSEAELEWIKKEIQGGCDDKSLKEKLKIADKLIKTLEKQINNFEKLLLEEEEFIKKTLMPSEQREIFLINTEGTRKTMVPVHRNSLQKYIQFFQQIRKN